MTLIEIFYEKIKSRPDVSKSILIEKFFHTCYTLIGKFHLIPIAFNIYTSDFLISSPFQYKCRGTPNHIGAPQIESIQYRNGMTPVRQNIFVKTE